MKIPNAEQTVVDIRKLRDYCLNTEHRIGKHKATLSESLLGLRVENAESLQATLLEIVKTHEAELDDKDEHGQRYQITFALTWGQRTTNVLSAWIVRPEEGFPCLVTCYPV